MKLIMATRPLAIPLAAALAFACLPASASEDAAGVEQCNVRVDAISTEILSKELELLRVNAKFRLESTKQPRLRTWRQFIYSETNAGCTEAGQITRMATSYPYMHTPQTIFSISRVKLSSGAIVQKITEKLAKAPSPEIRVVQAASAVSLVGQMFSATGEAFELSSNFASYLKARRARVDPRSYGQQVGRLIGEIDVLQHERDRATAQPDRVDVAEAALLRDLRDIGVSQYKQYHSAAIKLRAFQNAAFLASITKNTLGSAGNIVNIESSKLHDTKLGAAGSLLSAAAGVVTVLTPVVGRSSGNLAGLIDRRVAPGKFAQAQSAQTSDFVAHKLELDNLLSDAPETDTLASRRHLAYSQVAQLLSSTAVRTQSERKQAKQTTIENVVFGTIVGTSRIAQGSTGMVGAWNYPDQKWIASRLTAAGSTAYAGGAAFNIVETARVRVMDEVQTRALRRQGLLPSQELQAQMASLDKLQSSLGLGLASRKDMPSL